ncbi:glycosyltransferase family 2 protein [Phenylobacterium sp.]|jgi:glycosyltransferase involved in cell wall biosynthesis|uniref:glycosyltransferase family 2 protein n=1 Tax=Phenylobacterium sp. TaxID=1871053 RepID=UPI0025FFA346|nr:glycosyltransferase family 2 protein [Phenylobacterium sp.]MCA6286721.1 glycosyltransferase family 2 protein [Phenylobacterium sp.]MCA6310605.1 glycosyltransferase family 2 protein [Phenylobacterium sp.]MCA6324237.1 glycosyltransferase family 2 protein [Phenylobacterium sp.]MCA6337846.1 glycosyltransferase family 2 protein [Phenylobacterium sp.]MCA6340363.1 glycosyltransferase family 2 protein [Phenylobacterium sp.]
MPLDPPTIPTASPAPQVSVVVPVFNEAGAAPDLAREIAGAFAGQTVEILFVDDCSRDDTRERLAALKSEIPTLRLLAHSANSGQSRAVRTGVLAARGDIIVTLDGDGQNDPADAPKLVDALRAGPPDLALVGGERVKRQDNAAKKIASRIGNGVRRRLLRDTANDTGCGLKAFRREAFLRLPYFDHIHRYLPALMLREGYTTLFLPVGHRPRTSGASKYTNLGRLWASASDLAGVMWLQSRARRPGPVIEL